MLSKKGHVSLSGTQTKHLLTEQCLLQWYFSKHCSAKTFSIIFYCVHCINFTITNGFNSVQSLSHVWLFAIPWVAAHQASLSITNSQSLLKLMSIESVMPSNRLILGRALLLPSIFPSIRIFSNESVLCIWWPKYWSFSFSISPSSECSRLIFFRMDWLDLLAVQGTLKSLLQTTLQKHQFFSAQLSL